MGAEHRNSVEQIGRVMRGASSNVKTAGRFGMRDDLTSDQCLKDVRLCQQRVSAHACNRDYPIGKRCRVAALHTSQRNWWLHVQRCQLEWLRTQRYVDLEPAGRWHEGVQCALLVTESADREMLRASRDFPDEVATVRTGCDRPVDVGERNLHTPEWRAGLPVGHRPDQARLSCLPGREQQLESGHPRDAHARAYRPDGTRTPWFGSSEGRRCCSRKVQTRFQESCWAGESTRSSVLGSTRTAKA